MSSLGFADVFVAGVLGGVLAAERTQHGPVALLVLGFSLAFDLLFVAYSDAAGDGAGRRAPRRRSGTTAERTAGTHGATASVCCVTGSLVGRASQCACPCSSAGKLRAAIM